MHKDWGYIQNCTPKDMERNQSSLTKRYEAKKLNVIHISKCKMKYYLLCFNQLSEQQHHCSEAMILK